MWMIYIFDIPPYVATSECSVFVPRTLYSFDIPPYVPTFDCSIFVLRQLFSKSRQELLRRNGPRKPWAITPLKSRPADGSVSRLDETTIFLEAISADGYGDKLEGTTIFLDVGLFISGSRSNCRGVKNLEFCWRLELLPGQDQDQEPDQTRQQSS